MQFKAVALLQWKAVVNKKVFSRDLTEARVGAVLQRHIISEVRASRPERDVTGDTRLWSVTHLSPEVHERETPERSAART